MSVCTSERICLIRSAHVQPSLRLSRVVGEVADENVVNNDVLPLGEKRKRTQTNYARMFEDFTDDSEEDNEDEPENEDSSVYNDDDEADPQDEDLGNDLDVLFEKVHISAPTPGAPVQQIPAPGNATFKLME